MGEIKNDELNPQPTGLDDSEIWVPKLRELWTDPAFGFEFRIRISRVFNLGDDVSLESFVNATRGELIDDTNKTIPAEKT